MSGEDGMGSKQRFARAVCVVGGVFDGLMLLPMLLPGLGGKLFGLQAFSPGPDYRYAMNVAASLMLGWTLLLFWASRRPVERAAVLLLTAIVVAGLMLAGICAVYSGFISLGMMLPVFVLQCGLAALFLTGYIKASRCNCGSREDGGE
jgi:hypothetical protein